MHELVEAGFVRTPPEAQGVASAAVLDFLNAIEQSGQEVHSFMLVKNGCVVAEARWSPYGPNIPHTMFSLSKSFASTAVGMAVSEGYFTVEDTVLSFFPDAAPEHVNEHLVAMRVKHLLSMSTGHDVKTFPFMYERADGNWARGFFETPVIHPPGTHFLYNTGATYMLSEIIQRTTGSKLLDFLRPRLFEPLGIKNPTWQESPHGVTLAGIGLSITTEDIARLGQLYLQKGVWQGKRLLSEAWIEEATSAQVSNGDDPKSDWAQGYGYQFWRCQHGFYRGDGAFGQFCIVMEEHDVVLAMTSAAKDMQVLMNIVWDVLVPGLKAGVSAQDTASHNLLTEKTANLGYAPIDGQAASPTASRVSGKTYLAEPNQSGIERFTLDFTEAGCRLTVKTAQGEAIISAGHGKWHSGHTTLFDEMWLTGSQPFVASGAWLAGDRYVMIVRLYETPHIYTLTYDFEDDRVTVVTQVNVSLEATEPGVIKAIQNKA